MTVKEVLLLAAELLGLDEAKKFLSGETEESKEALALLRCFNFVENEIALDYFPLCAEDTLFSETGEIKFSNLSKAAVRILSVKDCSGKNAAYRLFPEFLLTQPKEVVISYTYTPTKKGLEDGCEVSSAVSERLMAFGVAAEYCVSCGLYDEGEIWDKKYKNALAAAYRVKPAKVTRSRRWA